jgi:predicted lipoprotein with Yx(FWY)xxD motif
MTRRNVRLLAVMAAVLAAGTTLAAEALRLPADIASRPRGDGAVFTDAKGMTLYTFDRDEGTPGRSACEGPCAALWPAMIAPAEAPAPEGWSKVTRADGSLQWAFRGRPVYRYATDNAPGATFGDGVGTVWRVAIKQIPVPQDVRIRPSQLGQILTDALGRTLYTSDDDTPGKTPKCNDDCARRFKPLPAPWAAPKEKGDWSAVARADGMRQWAFRGKPLYRYVAGDVSAGEIRGHGVDGWSAVVLEPAPPLPAWATIQPSDAGELIANREGLTVYAFGANARGQRAYRGPAMKCPDGACIDAQWKPFHAQPGDKPVGSWGITQLQDGKLQWTYKGNKLYTNVLDTGPGDFKGIRFGGDRSWSAIMRDGEPMQGVSVGG